MSNFRLFSIDKITMKQIFFLNFYAHFRNPRLKLSFIAKFQNKRSVG
jgi:hypothetical protein